MKVSIILPVYNESATLRTIIDRVLTAPLPPGCTMELVVVDDGSTDTTAAILDSYRDNSILQVHIAARNSGKGAAVRKGFELASGEAVLIQDGDLEYDPRDYAAVLDPIARGEADVVFGSRFLNIGLFERPRGMALPNLLANRILTLSANLLYSARITDEATAYKAFRASVLRRMKLKALKFELCPELTAKVRRLGYRIHEVPISYNGRGIADGKKIRSRDGIQALWTLLRCRFGRLG
jgi:dolichol-phosphate mannosyltransferase